MQYTNKSVRVFFAIVIVASTFLHAAHNHFDQGIFGILTAGEDKMFYVSETGLITIVCVWIIAIVLLASVSGETA